MCQEKIHKLKAEVKASGLYKQIIIINVSEEGIKIVDVRHGVVEHSHPVHKITFISPDMNDSRSFGYIYSTEDKKHQFYAIKTEKDAEAVMLTLRDLFQIIFERKEKEMEEAKKQQVEEKTEENKIVIKLDGELNTELNTDEEPVYSVSQNNQPVKERAGSSLVDLENELETIGQTEEVAKKARSILEFCQDTFTVPQEFAGLNQFGGLNRYDISQQRFTEDIAESDDCLLSESAGKKNICLSLTRRECPSPACLELHLQNGVPYLWQIKIDDEWASFLPKDNFKIEKAYCSLVDNVSVKGMVINGKECSIEVNFMKHEKDMYGIIHNDGAIWADIVPVAKIRRLSTPSFGEVSINIDSYATQWRWFWKDGDGAWLTYDSDLQIYTLEVKFLQQQKTYLFSRDNYRLQYRVCFKFMEQVNLEYGTRREIIRRPMFVSESDLQSKTYPQRIVSPAIELFSEDSKPSHFHPWDLANEFELVELDSTSGGEYTEVLQSFQQTMGVKKYEVKFIYRVQSRKLWLEYQTLVQRTWSFIDILCNNYPNKRPPAQNHVNQKYNKRPLVV